jgi:Nuclease-related domain
MARRTASSGRYAGQDFWGCSQYSVNGCPGRIHIGAPASETAAAPSAGTSAQARFEQEQRRYRLKLRAGLPFLTAVGLLVMAIMYFAFVLIAPWVGAVAAGLTGFGWIVLLTRLPADALFWDKGARGERKTGDYLSHLSERGFVLLHDRQIPGSRANIDHLAIGPTGVFVIETKNLSGKVEVIQDRLYVSDRLRTPYVDETYREAFAAQVALRELLEPLKATVVPVLCIHGARMPWFDHGVAGVRLVSGSQLERLVNEGPAILSDEQVQQIATLADRRLRAPYSWE